MVKYFRISSWLCNCSHLNLLIGNFGYVERFVDIQYTYVLCMTIPGDDVPCVQDASGTAGPPRHAAHKRESAAPSPALKYIYAFECYVPRSRGGYGGKSGGYCRSHKKSQQCSSSFQNSLCSVYAVMQLVVLLMCKLYCSTSKISINCGGLRASINMYMFWVHSTPFRRNSFEVSACACFFDKNWKGKPQKLRLGSGSGVADWLARLPCLPRGTFPRFVSRTGTLNP